MKKQGLEKDSKIVFLELANKAIQRLQANNFRSSVLAGDVRTVKRDLGRVIDSCSKSISGARLLQFKKLIEFCNIYLAIPKSAIRVSRNIGELFAKLNHDICELLTEFSHKPVSYEGL